MARQNMILGLQAISAIGIFALGLLTYFGQSSRDLRLEMRQGFESLGVQMREENRTFRTEMKREFAAFKTQMREENRAFRSEMRAEFGAFKTEMNGELDIHRTDTKREFADIRKELRNVNTRLSRIEGHLGIPPVQIPVP